MAGATGQLARQRLIHAVYLASERPRKAVQPPTFLFLNAWELDVSVDDAEMTILNLAAGSLSRAHLAKWVREHAKKR